MSQAALTHQSVEPVLLLVPGASVSWNKLTHCCRSLGLAPVIISQVFEALAQLNAGGLTILLIEQNAHLALTASNRAFVIEQGRIKKSGASKDLAEDPEVTALYLGQD